MDASHAAADAFKVLAIVPEKKYRGLGGGLKDH